MKDDYSNLISNIFGGNVRVLVNKTGLQDKEFERKAGIKNLYIQMVKIINIVHRL